MAHEDATPAGPFVDPAEIDPALAERKRRVPLLFLNVLLIAICGLVYELLAGTVASYLLGDSVTWFSLVIGVYLSAMGVGAWLSRFLVERVVQRFIELQLAIAVVGGSSAPLLFLFFGAFSSLRTFLFVEVFLIGTLVGLELPLLMRILEKDLQFKDLVSRVLAFDYLGALVASLLFPLVLVPTLGLVATALVMGLVNALVGLWATGLLRYDLGGKVVRGLRVRAAVVVVVLAVLAIKSDALSRLADQGLFSETIVYSETTPYQHIVVTQGRRGFQLYLNGNLQLDSADEYRYHEALVHPALAAAEAPPRRALLLGGGDGLALHQLLDSPGLAEVTLVDLDERMTALPRSFPALGELNGHSLDDPRVRVVNEDALVFVEEHLRSGGAPFDLVIIDFPDPNNYGLGKLYTRRFYALVARALAPGGVLAVQSTSPLYVRQSYWTVVETMEAAGLVVVPYQVTVPSFGVWGYALARHKPFAAPTALRPGTPPLRFLDDATLASLFQFPPDMQRVPAEVNRLDNQVLVRTYEAEAARWR